MGRAVPATLTSHHHHHHHHHHGRRRHHHTHTHTRHYHHHPAPGLPCRLIALLLETECTQTEGKLKKTKKADLVDLYEEFVMGSDAVVSKVEDVTAEYGGGACRPTPLVGATHPRRANRASRECTLSDAATGVVWCGVGVHGVDQRRACCAVRWQAGSGPRACCTAHWQGVGC